MCGCYFPLEFDFRLVANSFVLFIWHLVSVFVLDCDYICIAEIVCMAFVSLLCVCVFMGCVCAWTRCILIIMHGGIWHTRVLCGALPDTVAVETVLCPPYVKIWGSWENRPLVSIYSQTQTLKPIHKYITVLHFLLWPSVFFTFDPFKYLNTGYKTSSSQPFFKHTRLILLRRSSTPSNRFNYHSRHRQVRITMRFSSRCNLSNRTVRSLSFVH